MKTEDFQSLRGLSGDPDQTPPRFRRRFAIKVRRSLVKISG